MDATSATAQTADPPTPEHVRAFLDLIRADWPGTSFVWNEATWVRRLFRGTLRAAQRTDDGLIVAEQNPSTASRWAEQARAGRDVWQVWYSRGPRREWVAVVVDGQWTYYADVSP